jgi:hypothetical protein
MWKGRCAATVRRARSSSGLKVLQPVNRNVAGSGDGRGRVNLKTAIKKEQQTRRRESHVAVTDKENSDVYISETRSVEDKGVQVEITDHISPKSSCNQLQPTPGSELSDEASTEVSMEYYWMELAEKRRQALAETLLENEELCAEVAILKCKVRDLEVLANNLRYQSIVASAMEKDDCSSSTDGEEHGSSDTRGKILRNVS